MCNSLISFSKVLAKIFSRHKFFAFYCRKIPLLNSVMIYRHLFENKLATKDQNVKKNIKETRYNVRRRDNKQIISN